MLPKGFFKVRYYGIFSSRHRKENIEKAKHLLELEAENKKEEALDDGDRVWEKQDTVWDEILNLIKNHRQPTALHAKKEVAFCRDSKGCTVAAWIVPG